MAETKITSAQTANDVWTSTNLTAGTNITFSQVLQPIIDANTLGVWHFEDDAQTGGSFVNSVTGATAEIKRPMATAGGTGTTKDLWTSLNAAKFGTRSLRFGGADNHYFENDQYFVLTKGSAGVLPGDLTYDFWFYATSYNASLKMFGWGANFCLQNNSGKTDYVLHSSADGDFSLNLTLNTWHHIAFQRKNNTLFFFYDGNLINPNSTQQSSYAFGDDSCINIKYASSSSSPFYIDELRLSNIARYDGNFTPFELPYSYGGDPIYQINSSGGISTIPYATSTTVGGVKLDFNSNTGELDIITE